MSRQGSGIIMRTAGREEDEKKEQTGSLNQQVDRLLDNLLSGNELSYIAYDKILNLMAGHPVKEEAIRIFAEQIVPRLMENQNNKHAQFALSDCYGHGLGVPKSEQEYNSWLERAADNGCASAQFNLARDKLQAAKNLDCMHVFNQSVLCFNEALRLFNEAAVGNHPHALTMLAMRAHKGSFGQYMVADSRRVDFYEAVSLFRRAGELGEENTQVPITVIKKQIKEGYDKAFKGEQSAPSQAISSLIRQGRFPVNVVIDDDGNTPLHLAYKMQHKEEAKDVVKLLLDNGANPYTKNKDGKIPCDLSGCGFPQLKFKKFCIFTYFEDDPKAAKFREYLAEVTAYGWSVCAEENPRIGALVKIFDTEEGVNGETKFAADSATRVLQESGIAEYENLPRMVASFIEKGGEHKFDSAVARLATAREIGSDRSPLG